MPQRIFVVLALFLWLVSPSVTLSLTTGTTETLSNVPLNLKETVPPNVLFALSVEYPTADDAAYPGVSDYTSANQYLGLFDQNKCYQYDTTNLWFYAPSSTLAANHVCSGGYWSGNFLNWATMTGLDEFRFAMTGGNRIVDTATQTVLQRTYIDTQATSTSNGDFPDKTFTPSGNYAGAVPSTFGAVTYTVHNAGMGVQMQITTASTATTISCATWYTTSPYNCKTFTMAFNPNSSTITCTTWSNTSTKKTCSAFSSTNSAESISSITCKTTTTSGGVTGHCSVYNVNYSWGQNYNVQVKSCDTTAGLENNCTLYGSTYKPIGVIQQYGTGMRFGVVSYFNSSNIDNAVLRSKLKYVAPQQYASSIGTTTNANAEWSAANGTFINNPDPTVASASYNGAVSNSGVINYINQFGSTAHAYKVYDNIGKLYYEALAYLRNQTPDRDFYYGVTSSNNDGFPVITTWDDPIIYACQKNYIMLMGDANTHCDKRLPGGTYTSTQNSCSQCGTSGGYNGTTADYGDLKSTGARTNTDPGLASTLPTTNNVVSWTNKLGNLEIGNSGSPTYNKSQNTLATTITGAGCASYYTSGLAYYANSTDIRPDNAAYANTLGNQSAKTFVIDVEEYGYYDAYSQLWYAAKYGGADSYDASGNPVGWSLATAPITLPQGTAPTPWPKNLLPAGNPLAMITAVQGAFQTIQAGIDNDAALASSTGNLQSVGGAYVYQAIFNSGGWIGDVLAYAINAIGTISNTATWAASTWLTNTTPSSRNIFSFNDGLKANGTAETTDTNARLGISLPQSGITGTNFATLFSARQQSLLNANNANVTDGWGVDRVNYLRGDTSNEGTAGHQWRARLGEIGDIVDSTPAYVAAPLAGLVGPGYGTFQTTYANRKPMLYVGANDGFLHGFDASPPGTSGATPGQELMAYIPAAVYANLSQLMSSNYPHAFYVDGNPVAGEACFGACPADGSGWKTMLVGGLRAGGQGIYALNVTNPSSFATATGPNMVLWEFTDRDDADLGYTFADPIIKKMSNGRWAVIFGNGYNNTFSDGSVSATGRAYLYIVFVDGPSGTGKTWTLNTDYFKIALKTSGEPSTLPNIPANGLSGTVAVDTTLDGTVDLIYAGDRFGNLWKFDVSSTSPSSWGVALGSAASPTPLFTAKDSLGNAQQFTTIPAVSRHPQGGYLVYIGTGSYIDTTDPLPQSGTTFNTDTFYGIWDQNNLTSAQRASFSSITRSQLQGQAELATVTSGGSTYYIQSDCIPNYGTTTANTYPLQADGKTADYANCPSTVAQSNVGQQMGWLFDLPGAGERVVANRPLIQGGVVTFTTLTPATNPCTGNTVGNMFDLNYLTGGRLTQGLGGVYDLNSNQLIDGGDKFVITALGSVASNPSTWVAPSGQLLISGASNTPLRMELPPGLGTSGSGSGGSSSSTITSTGGCSDFISGWGCMSGLGRPVMGASFMDIVSNQNLSGNGLLPTGNNIDTTQLQLYVPSGRVSWHQIIR